MKKRNIVFIVTLLTVFICSIGFAEQQDEPKIEKGQLIQAPKIVRSSKVNRNIDKKHHPLKTYENPLNVLFKAQVPPGIWSETKNCGQTSALMVFCYYNAITPTEQGIKNIDDWLYQKYGDPINNYNGSETNTTKLEELAKEYGEFTNSYKANDWDIERLKQEIDAGHPVIVAVIAGYLSNRGYEWAGGHFVVAKGYNDTHIICNDPGTSQGNSKYYINNEFSDAMAAQNGAVVVVPYYTAEFEEDFESGVGLWSTSGSWEIGAPTSGPNSGYESTNCAATNLYGNYSNYANDWLISTTIILPEITHPSGEIKLYFWEWFSIESSYDNGRVKISTDGGTNWTELSSRDGSSDWRETEIDLTSYENETIKIAFNFTSDGSYTYSGWYLDDIHIELEEPEPLTATMISLNSQNFPFIYMNVAVDTFGVGFPDLEQSNFQVYENGTLQTDYFEVTPPETGGGSRRADIIFLMDNSGSMSDEINAVSNNVLDFVDNLVASGIDFALGLCRYGQSAYGGNPIIEDNGILTNDANYFKYDVWARNYASGGTEPGYYAIVQSANSFGFSSGAQKIFIIITDETPDQGGASESDALNTCVKNSPYANSSRINLHKIFQVSNFALK